MTTCRPDWRFRDAPLSPDIEAGHRDLVTEPGVELHVISKVDGENRFRQATIDATRAIVGDPEMSRDSNAWYRQTAAEIDAHRDGVTLDATGSGPWTRALGKVLGRPSDQTMNRYWLDATADHQTIASAFCIAMQPLNQLAERQDREETRGFVPEFTAVLRDLMIVPDRRAQMLFRIGYPRDVALASPRWPLTWVLSGE